MKIKPIIFAAALAVGATGCATTYGATETSDNTIVETVVMSPDHETLEALVKAAGLAETLGGPGPFTVFAPTDAGIMRLPASTRSALTQPENREMLRGILTYHVVAGDFKAADVIGLINDGGGSAMLKTVQGTSITATLDNGFVKLTDAVGNVTFVETPDIDASNGTIHSIGAVMMPRR